MALRLNSRTGSQLSPTDCANNCRVVSDAADASFDFGAEIFNAKRRVFYMILKRAAAGLWMLLSL